MNDINRDEARNETSKAQDKIHERNCRMARLWWKYFAIRKISKAAKKGKNSVKCPRCGKSFKVHIWI